MGKGRIDLVGELRSGLGIVAKADEELPVDGPAGRDGTESPQVIAIVGEYRTLDIRVELVLRSDHGVPETVSGYRKFHRHELQIILPEPRNPWHRPVGVREDTLIRRPFQ